MHPTRERLKEVIDRLGDASNYAIARVTGISETAVREWRQGVGKKAPEMDTLVTFAKAVGLSLGAATAAEPLPGDFPSAELATRLAAEKLPRGRKPSSIPPPVSRAVRSAGLDEVLARMSQAFGELHSFLQSAGMAEAHFGALATISGLPQMEGTSDNPVGERGVHELAHIASLLSEIKDLLTRAAPLWERAANAAESSDAKLDAVLLGYGEDRDLPNESEKTDFSGTSQGR